MNRDNHAFTAAKFTYLHLTLVDVALAHEALLFSLTTAME